MKIVLDTNVLVSGFLSPSGTPAAILRSVLTGRIAVCFDERILAEYRDVLTRGKFKFDHIRVSQVLAIIELHGTPVLAEALPLELPDPDDAMFIEVAAAGDANCVVTGNLKHFQTGSAHGVRVISPRAFLKEFLRR